MKKNIIKRIIILTVFALIFGLFLMKKKQVKELEKIARKYFDMFALTAQWVRNNQQGLSIADYLSKQGYKKICVYGMGYLGDLLCDELKGSGIDVIYAIDKDINVALSNSNKNMRVASAYDQNEKVDAMIVTVIQQFENIRMGLKKVTNCPILSLEGIIYESAGV